MKDFNSLNQLKEMEETIKKIMEDVEKIEWWYNCNPVDWIPMVQNILQKHLKASEPEQKATDCATTQDVKEEPKKEDRWKVMCDVCDWKWEIYLPKRDVELEPINNMRVKWTSAEWSSFDNSVVIKMNELVDRLNILSSKK